MTEHEPDPQDTHDQDEEPGSVPSGAAAAPSEALSEQPDDQDAEPASDPEGR